MIVYGRRRGGGAHDGTLCARYLHLLIFRIQYYSPPLAYPFVSEQQTLPAMVVDMMAAGGGGQQGGMHDDLWRGGYLGVRQRGRLRW